MQVPVACRFVEYKETVAVAKERECIVAYAVDVTVVLFVVYDAAFPGGRVAEQ